MTSNSANQKVALISAATDPIGEGIALRLAAQGLKLALTDQPGERLAALQKRIADAGGQAIALPVASTTAQSIQGLVGEVLSRFERIDVLVNNTPEPPGMPLSGVTAQDFDGTIDAILGRQSHLLREVMPGMRRNGYGRVINIASLAYLGSAKGVNVAAAQAGLFGLTRSVALEAARDNVTVNSVVRGDIADPTMSEEASVAVANGIPVKRLGTAADIANAVAFFAAERTKYVTGQTLFVCGGKSVYYSMSV